jgi:hypothetical protein
MTAQQPLLQRIAAAKGGTLQQMLRACRPVAEILEAMQ